MRQGGRSLELTLVRPDESREVLLFIRNFPQDWQTPYVFREPVDLPAGSVLQATAYFDAAKAGSPSVNPALAASPAVSFMVSLNHYPAKALR